jgi:uncharacterized protein (DUF1501 family)
MDRRDFLKHTGIITAGSLFIPSFLRASAFPDTINNSYKRLIIIQLSGGNDGLNTVVPYGLDEYHQNRTKIGLDASSLLKINEKFGFNPALKELHNLYENGVLSIINSVGYPNPNRSHFRSMDIWHSASDANEYLQTGWLGRYMDSYCNNAHEGIELEGSLSLALKGEEKSGIALTDPNAFYKTIHSNFYNQLQTPESLNNELNYLYQVFNETKNSAGYIFDQYKLKENTVDYGSGQFAKKIKQIATLVKSGINTPVFYTSLGGFDTHVNQQVSQANLLKQLDQSVGSLVKDLEKEGMMEDTTIMIFSEFGRRLAENASRGTDHGAANVMFIIDKNLDNKAHSLNNINLMDLENGDPKFQIDFRSVYQDILFNRMNVDAKKILGKSYNNLGLFKG